MLKKTILFSLFILLFVEVESTAKHSDPVTFRISYLEDTLHDLSFDEAIQSKYTPSHTSNLVFGITQSAYWVKLKIEDNDADEIVIEVNRPLLDSLSFYYYDLNGNVHASHYGLMVEDQLLTEGLNTIAETVQLDQVKNREIYLRGQARYTVVMPIGINRKTEFVRQQLVYNFFSGLLFGGLLVIMIYNFFLWVSSQEKVYLIYVFTVFFAFIAQMGVKGYAFQFFIKDYPSVAYYWVNFSILLGTLNIIWFAIEFLDLRKISVRMIRSLYWFIASCVMVFIFEVMSWHSITQYTLVISSIAGTIQLIIIGGILWNRGIQSAKFYTIAWLVYLIGIALYSLRTVGLIPHNYITHNLVHLGSFLEITLLSFALGYKYSEVKKENEKLQIKLSEELSALVEQRTAELHQTLKEKEVLLNEVHHRVKNNLQIINSMLAIQRRRFPHSIKELLLAVQNRIRSISLVHEQLYTDQLHASIHANNYIEKLVDSIESSMLDMKKEVEFNLEISPDIILPMDVAIPMGLIVNETISNAIKHAFEDAEGDIQGKIDITMSRIVAKTEDRSLRLNNLQLVIKDNGKSNRKSNADPNTSPDTNLKINLHEGTSKTSMGTRIIDDMCMQLDAHKMLDTSKGYHYKIIIPLNEKSGN